MKKVSVTKALGKKRRTSALVCVGNKNGMIGETVCRMEPFILVVLLLMLLAETIKVLISFILKSVDLADHTSILL